MLGAAKVAAGLFPTTIPKLEIMVPRKVSEGKEERKLNEGEKREEVECPSCCTPPGPAVYCWEQ
jgi:hypothetical protein